jgi:hypothetical protein
MLLTIFYCDGILGCYILVVALQAKLLLWDPPHSWSTHHCRGHGGLLLGARYGNSQGQTRRRGASAAY